MEVKKIALFLSILICGFSCSDSHIEPDETDNPDNTATIYDLFPNYNDYSGLYDGAYIKLENIETGKFNVFSVDEAVSLLQEEKPEWKIPSDAPYLYNEYFGVIRLIRTNKVRYKEAFEIFPNYFYYECLLSVKKLYELENTETKERQQFEINNAERLLRNSNGEWKIPNDAPYLLDSGTNIGLRLVRISEICRTL